MCLPLPSSDWSALRPLVPKPQMTTWSCNFLLQTRRFTFARVADARNSSVVPTSRIRNSTRSGVTTKVVSSRALSETGTMSP
jgi:hypothetical protein